MDFSALFQQAVGFHQGENLSEAARLYGGILVQEPGNFAARQLLALVRFQQGRDTEALDEIAAALTLNPQSPEALATRGNILIRLTRLDEALASFDAAIAIKPDYAEALYNRGNCHQYLGLHDAAVADYTRALALQPDYEPALTNRGNARRALKRFDQALADYARVEQLRPGDGLASYHRACVLADLGRHDEAVVAHDAALAKDTSLAKAWDGRGNALRALRRFDEALASYDHALALTPDDVDALFHRGTLQWSEFGHYAQALTDLEHVVRLDPDHEYALGNLLHLKMYGGDWRDYEQAKAAIDQGVRAGKRIVEPFVYQAISDAPADLLACARIQAALYPASAPTPHKAKPYQKIRVGYLSGEFRAQATQYLMAGLYERHDRDAFQIVAFDNGQSDGSPMRARLEAAFDTFIPIAGLGDRQAAQRIRDEEIDILVNLNGYFGRHRMGVFAMRPAPVQVNYLGFPGTLGAPYMDYILADRIVLRDEDTRYFTEQVVWLPECYQVNDDRRAIAAELPTRAEEDLPETGFVFCNFNQSYKLTPDTFALWMRVLRQTDGSVLWLIAGNDEFPTHLRQEAERQGVAGDRLIFARNQLLDRHLARLQLADLFLDGLPYNAHTTASDALWAAVPLITRPGHAFAGRVAASLLTTLDLPELIAPDDTAYEALALKLAHDPSALRALKEKLARNRAASPLFDTDHFRKNIEAAYRKMWEIAERGEKPISFSI